MDLKTRQIESVIQELKTVYANPSRFYHNLDHIYGMLDRLDKCCPLAIHPHRIKLAIWFHDAVYDPKASDNEIKSAELWDRKMPLFLDEAILEWGRRAILASIDHLPNKDHDIQLFLDLDLAPLGDPWETFQAAGEALRKEASHLDTNTFNKRRKKFLEHVLERPRIFGTNFWHSHLEEQAQENIRRAIYA